MESYYTNATVHSVDKAMNLIEILLSARRAMSLNELATIAGYPKSTTHALLSTLREHAMISQSEDGRYCLGIRLFECGCAVSSSWDISLVSRPHLEYLAYSSGETAYLSMINQYEIIIIDQVMGNSGMKIVSNIGSKLPAHCTSQGKLLLSQYSDSEVNVILSRTDMRAYTPHTIIDIPKVIVELKKIRTNGYATEDGEYKIGLRSVSAPVYDNTGRMKYALGIIGLLGKIDSEKFRTETERVCRAAYQMSQELGYRK